MVSPLQIVQPGQTRTRKKRSPSFPMAGTLKPYGIYPLFASPVLPGETLNSAEMKYRVVSQPIRHPLVGAWFETWLCYVSLTDIDAALAEMFISDAVPTTGFTAAADQPRYFTKAGKIDYIRLATEAVVQAYFRDEGEPANKPGWNNDGVLLAKRANWDWAQNLMFKPDNMVMADMPSSMPEGGSLTPLEIMKLAGMSEITYEKYLQQYGVISSKVEAAAKIPEILRYTRSWTLPTNTVEATTGKPSSCWAWSETLKAEKAKRFDEPGFLIWLGCVRPKLYDSTITSSLIGSLWGFSDFFPVYNLDDPAAGIKQLDPGFVTNTSTGPKPLIYDHRDLLSHGEAFVNDWAGPYDLPKATGRSITDTSVPAGIRNQFPKSTDIDALFVEPTVDAKRRLIYEGIASLEITGHVVDTTR